MASTIMYAREVEGVSCVWIHFYGVQRTRGVAGHHPRTRLVAASPSTTCIESLDLTITK
jgi:hypothetical protein